MIHLIPNTRQLSSYFEGTIEKKTKAPKIHVSTPAR